MTATRWTSWGSSEREFAPDGTQYIVDADPGDEDRSLTARDVAGWVERMLERARNYKPCLSACRPRST